MRRNALPPPHSLDQAEDVEGEGGEGGEVVVLGELFEGFEDGGDFLPVAIVGLHEFEEGLGLVLAFEVYYLHLGMVVLVVFLPGRKPDA